MSQHLTRAAREMRDIAIDEIRKAGLTPIEPKKFTGRHLKIEFEFAGKRYPIFYSRSSGDWRAQNNHRTIVRSRLIEAGAIRLS